MADPINTRIVNAIMSRLRNISVANGYAFDVGVVAIADRDADQWNPSQNDIYVEQGEEAFNEDGSCSGNPYRVAWTMPVSVHGFTKPLDIDVAEVAVVDKSISENEMLAAMQKAIANNDAGEWHSFGGLAIESRFSRKMKADFPGWDGATLTLSIVYRTSELDATVVG